MIKFNEAGAGAIKFFAGSVSNYLQFDMVLNIFTMDPVLNLFINK